MELLVVLSCLLSVCVCQEESLPSGSPFYTQYQYGYGGGSSLTVVNQGRGEKMTLPSDISHVNFSRTLLDVDNELRTQGLKSTTYFNQPQEISTQIGSQNATLGELKLSEVPLSRPVIVLPPSPVTKVVQPMSPASTTKLELNDFLNPFITTPSCSLSPHDPNVLHHPHPHPPPPHHPHLHLHPHPPPPPHPHPHPHPDPPPHPHLHLHPHPPPDPHHHHPHLYELQHNHIEGIDRIPTPNPFQLNIVDNVAVPSSSPKFFSTEQIIALR